MEIKSWAPGSLINNLAKRTFFDDINNIQYYFVINVDNKNKPKCSFKPVKYRNIYSNPAYKNLYTIEYTLSLK